MKYTVFATLSLAVAVSARPSFSSTKRAEFTLKNGEDAIALKCVLIPIWFHSYCSLQV